MKGSIGNLGLYVNEILATKCGARAPLMGKGMCSGTYHFRRNSDKLLLYAKSIKNVMTDVSIPRIVGG